MIKSSKFLHHLIDCSLNHLWKQHNLINKFFREISSLKRATSASSRVSDWLKEKQVKLSHPNTILRRISMVRKQPQSDIKVTLANLLDFSTFVNALSMVLVWLPLFIVWLSMFIRFNFDTLVAEDRMSGSTTLAFQSLPFSWSVTRFGKSFLSIRACTLSKDSLSSLPTLSGPRPRTLSSSRIGQCSPMNCKCRESTENWYISFVWCHQRKHYKRASLCCNLELANPAIICFTFHWFIPKALTDKSLTKSQNRN